MKKGKWFNALAMAMTASLAVTSVPAIVQAKSSEGFANKYSDEGYSLVWNDEFDGESLNTSDWNVEQHEPGWVNSELQRYTSLDEGNIQVKDGKLSLKPHVTETESTDDNDDAQVEEKVTNVSFDFSFDAEDSDTIAVQLNFGKIDSLGDAGVAQATVKLSNLSLVDTEDDTQIFTDRNFENGGWSCGISAPGKGSYSFEDGKAVINIEDSGDANWNIQLQQTGIKLQQGVVNAVI